MSEPYGYRMAERDALDALVDAEVELVLRRRPRLVVEPEIDELLFLEQATAFLLDHVDPARLLGELQRRIAAAAPTSASPPPAAAPEPQAETPAPVIPPQADDPL